MTLTFDRRIGRLAVRCTILVVLAGCTAIRPPRVLEQAAPTPTFSHADFDRVLQRFVDAEGRVDYVGLQRDPGDLDRYYDLVARYSPDSHPELFPTADSKLAYWINAYNAVAIRIVLAHYPITGITDIDTPFPVNLVSPRAGFFLLNRATFGGATTSLYYLENSVIRKRFREPRIHFAVNCASRGCPRLPREAFTGEHLQQQLDREARRFFAEERNLRIDHANRTVFLSSILKWYTDDFVDWYAVRHPGTPASLLAYAALYAPERTADLQRATVYTIEFVEYDWRLNDSNTPA